MTYSDAGTLSPETQSAIEQEIRILLRVIFFWAWFFLLLFYKMCLRTLKMVTWWGAVNSSSPECLFTLWSALSLVPELQTKTSWW